MRPHIYIETDPVGEINTPWATLFDLFNTSKRCDMAFIEPMHRNKPNIT